MNAPSWRLTQLQRDCVRHAAFMPLKRVGRRYVASGGRSFSSVTVDSLTVRCLLKSIYMGADVTEWGSDLADQLGGPVQ